MTENQSIWLQRLVLMQACQFVTTHDMTKYRMLFIVSNWYNVCKQRLTSRDVTGTSYL